MQWKAALPTESRQQERPLKDGRTQRQREASRVLNLLAVFASWRRAVERKRQAMLQRQANVLSG